jgi:hypothetical protein
MREQLTREVAAVWQRHRQDTAAAAQRKRLAGNVPGRRPGRRVGLQVHHAEDRDDTLHTPDIELLQIEVMGGVSYM